MQNARTELLAHMDHYRDCFPTEAFVVERFKTLLNEQPNCFDRNCFNPGHITASAWVVDATGHRVLLTHHRKLERWLQLGGHTDGQEDTLASAAREAWEESGLADLTPWKSAIFDIDIHTIPARAEEPIHAHYDIRYAFQCNGNPAFTVSDESHALAWVSIRELQYYTQESSMLRMATKWTHRSRAYAAAPISHD